MCMLANFKLRHTITSLICLLCGTFSLRFLGKSPHHLHGLISVAPLHVQYDSAKWEPGKWEPSWNLPQFLPEKWELSYLGPGGLDSVFYLPCTV